MVDVGQLRAIRTIAEAGSITAAARELGMSQPGLSRLVERVEDELDANLFVRGRTGAEPTPEGRKVVQFAISTLSGYDALRASVGGGRRAKGDMPLLRIVASTTPGEFLLPQIATAFTSVHSGILIDTLITDSASVAGLLLSHECDIGFTGKKADYESLEYVPVARDEVVLAVPVSHRLANLSQVSISDLQGERLLRRNNGSGTYEVVRAALEKYGQQLPTQAAEVTLGSTQSVMSAVDAGLGIGFVTLRAIEHHAPSRVAAVRILDVPVIRDLFLVYEKTRTLSTSADAFLRFVEQKAATDYAAD